ncbi:gluconate 2-dehydrogenase subunit 3 family protein [Altererythrobacter sp.]|uniref:gluconate 2-dehydrogenase subunit 3 family protein n=1 Tax=Altererythrobacter sp. TaxID=1872480 RepID=UPI003D0B3DE4
MSICAGRREILQAAILLVGGGLFGGTLASCSKREQDGPFFEPEAFALLDAVCETLIPQTDTPGASAAGVPQFIDDMMRNWASDETRATFQRALTAIDDMARAESGKRFVELAPDTRTAMLSAHDAKGEEDWRALRQLTLMGYYLSEPGATEELRYELVPGQWEPNVPVTPDTRAWAVKGV